MTDGGRSQQPSWFIRWLRATGIFMEMIKVSHSIFALPFAIAAAFLASLQPEARFDLLLLVKIIIACVLARTAAMSFNRWADRHLDARNPRTASRALPAGQLHAWTVITMALVCAALFVAVCAWINPLALALSPVVLVVLFGYSYTKRFTQASHLVLGLALGLSPVGAWVAVLGKLDLLPGLLGLGVLLWTAGFDVIYACQDTDIDRAQGLHSIPQRWGIARALLISRLFHALTVSLLIAVGLVGDLGMLYFSGVIIVVALLVYEQSLIKPADLSRVNVAFFTLNGLVSLAFMAATIAEVVWC